MEFVLGQQKLRPWTIADVPSLARYANNPNVSRTLRDVFPYPYTEADAERFIRRHHDENPVVSFAVASSLESIGGIGIHLQQDVHRRSAEIGYWLGEPFWNQGIMSRALSTVTDYAFSAFDIMRMYALVFEGNEASCRVLEKAGYILEGRLRKSVTKDGITIDSFMYAKIRDYLQSSVWLIIPDGDLNKSS